MKKFLGLLLGITLLLSGCADQREEVHKYSFFAFGTIIKLSITGVETKLADQAAKELELDFQKMHKAWHAWQPSPLSTINEYFARGEDAPLDADLRPLLLRAQQLAAISEGTFNPAIGNLLELWGYHSDELPDAPPPEMMIDLFLQQVPDLAELEFSDNQVRTNNTNTKLDLGGFAKGYGVDRAIEHLKMLGINNAIVDAGGDLKVIGKRVDRPWRIGIRHPRKESILATLEVNDGESVFTSGDYERFFFYKNKRYHHILDPRTGYPADDLISVTVVHPDAALADAAATALFVAGNDWQRIAKKMAVDQVMVVDAAGKIHMTSAMASRVLLADPKIVDSKKANTETPDVKEAAPNETR